MTSEFVSIYESLTVDRAVEYIRRTGKGKKPRLDVAEVYMTPVEAYTDSTEQWMALTIRYYPAAFRG